MARTKPYFRVHLSIAGHKNTAVIWSNLTDRAIYAELGRLAMVKYAGKTDDTFYLSTKELMAITCTENAGAAGNRWRAFLEHCQSGADSLGGHSPVTAESLERHSRDGQRTVGRHWRVTFRNLAEKHGMSGKKDKQGPPKKKKEEGREKKEEEEESAGAFAPTQWAEPFVQMLKGQIPTGLNDETWATARDWLGFHESLIRAEGELKANGQCAGPEFTAAFKVVMMRFWNAKSPPNRTNGSGKPTTQAERVALAAEEQERAYRADPNGRGF